MCSPPPTLRNLSPSLLSGSPLGGSQEAEQFVIHTQRGPSPQGDSKRTERKRNAPVGSPNSPDGRRRGGRQANSRHSPHGGRGDTAPQEKTRVRGSPARATPTKSYPPPSPQSTTPLQPSPIAPVVTTRVTDEELRRQNEELRQQVETLRAEFQYTCEFHSEVVTSVVKENKELHEMLEAERSVIASRIMFDAKMKDLNADISKGPQEDAPTATTTMPVGPCASPDVAKVSKADAVTDEKMPEGSTARSISPSPSWQPSPSWLPPDDSVHSFLIVAPKEDATSFTHNSPECERIYAEAAKQTPTRFEMTQAETLATRAQCWELQGALRRALQETQQAALRQAKAENGVHAPPPPPPSPSPAQISRATLPGRKSSSSLATAMTSVNGRTSISPVRSRSTLSGVDLATLAARGAQGPPRLPRAPHIVQCSATPVDAANSSGVGLVPLGDALVWNAPLKPGPSRSSRARAISPPIPKHAQQHDTSLSHAFSMPTFRGSSSASTAIQGDSVKVPATPTMPSFGGSMPPVATSPCLSRTPSVAAIESGFYSRDTTPIRGSNAPFETTPVRASSAPFDTTPIRGNSIACPNLNLSLNLTALEQHFQGKSPIAGASYAATPKCLSRTPSVESLVPVALKAATPCRPSSKRTSSTIKVMTPSASAPRLTNSSATFVSIGPSRQASGKLPLSTTPSAHSSQVTTARGGSAMVPVAFAPMNAESEVNGKITLYAAPSTASTARFPQPSVANTSTSIIVTTADSYDRTHLSMADYSSDLGSIYHDATMERHDTSYYPPVIVACASSNM